MLMFIVDKSLPIKISSVALEVRQILGLSVFHKELCKYKENFPQSNIDGPTLSQEIKRILEEGENVKINGYSYPFYKFYFNNTVVAHVPRNSTNINLTRKLLSSRSDIQYANTIAHEFVHVVDNLSPYYFGHGDNNPEGDELTAPHVVGDLVERLYIQRSNHKAIYMMKGDFQSFLNWFEWELGNNYNDQYGTPYRPIYVLEAPYEQEEH